MTLVHITLQQQRIISLLSHFRFLNRLQLQLLLHLKTPGSLNRLLTDLVTKEYLTRFTGTSFAERSNPAVYSLSHNSIRFIIKQQDIPSTLLKNRYNEKYRSADFIARSLLIATLSLQWSEQEKQSMDFILKDQIPDTSILSDLHPDISFVLGSKQYHLEILPEYFPRFRIRSRVNLYCNALMDQIRETASKAQPAILFICSNTKQQSYIHAYVARKRRNEDMDGNCQFYLTTRQRAEKEGIRTPIWQNAE